MAEAAGGSAAPAAAQTPAPNGAPPAARNNGGQFSPKDGATGVVQPPAKPAIATKPAGEPPPVEKKPEPYRFKRKLGDRDVDLDESGLETHLKELEWRRKQQGDTARTKKELDELVALAQNDSEAFFKKIGVDLDAQAERKLQERMRLAQLTPQEQEFEKLKGELDKRDQTLKQREAEQQKLVQEQRRLQVVQANRIEYEAALGASVLPHSRAKLFMMTQIQKGMQESGAPKLSPQNLGKAYDEMMLSAFDEVVNTATTKPETLQRWPGLPKLGIALLAKLEGAQLLEQLGPAITRKVLQASLANHRGQQTIPSQRGVPAARPPTPPGGEFDEVELENRKRALYATFK